MPGSTPATSQLDWLSSTTAMIVLSWSKATRDLLKSFSWGIGALRQLFASDDGAISFAACPIPSHCWRKPDSNLRFPDRSAPLREQSASHVGLTVSRPGTEISKSISLQRRVYCEPGRPGPGGMASAAATLGVADAGLRRAHPSCD